MGEWPWGFNSGSGEEAAAAPSVDEDEEDGTDTLSIVALVIGALGLVAGVTALVLTSRQRGAAAVLIRSGRRARPGRELLPVIEGPPRSSSLGGTSTPTGRRFGSQTSGCLDESRRPHLVGPVSIRR